MKPQVLYSCCSAATYQASAHGSVNIWRGPVPWQKKFTHSRIAPRIILDLNPWCSGAQHHGHGLFLLRYHSLNSLMGLSLIHGSQHGTSRVIAPGSSVLSPASSMLAPSSTCRHRASIRRNPWRTGISVIKNKTCAIFHPRVHGWKMVCTTPGRHRVPSV